ncbi:hypothetical protein GCM10008929_22370 [Alkalibacterium psychrotolerans]
MKTQHKSMLTHFITLLFVIFQFVQFMPSSLLTAITASAQSASPVTLFSDDKGSGDVKWTVSEDGKQITWNITVNQAASETEASPVAEIKLPGGIGEPKIDSATLNGNSIGTTFTTVNGNYRFNPQSYSLDSQKLDIQFKTEVSDLNADTLAFGVGGAIELVDTQATPSLQNITVPNRLAQIEKERIAEEERLEAERIAAEEEAARIAEEERLAAEQAEAERLEAEQKAEEERLEAERLAQEQADKVEAERLAQEEADKKAEEERLAAERVEAEQEAEAAELEEEEDKEDSIALEEEQDVEEEVEDIELEVKAEEDSEAVEELDSVMMMAESIGILSTFNALNYFSATGISINQHYAAVGIFIDTEDNVRLILDNVTNTANQSDFHSPMLNGQNALNYSTDFNVYNQYWVEVGAQLTLNVGGETIVIEGERLIVFDFGPMTNTLEEINTISIDNRARGFRIEGMTVTLDLDYTITKEVEPTTATIGDELIYTITVTNNGDLALSNVDVFDDTPDEITVLQVKDGSGEWMDAVLDNGRVQLASGISLAANGVSRTFLVKAYVNDNAVDGQELTNTATIGGAFAPKTDTSTVMVEATDVSIQKFITGTDADMDEEFEFSYSIVRPGEIEVDHYYSPVNDTFMLGDSDIFPLNNLPTDALLTLSEESGEYEVTVTANGTEVLPNSEGTYEFNLADFENLEIIVTNDLTVPKEDFTVIKEWVGGPEENKNPVDINITLWQTTDGITLTEVEVDPDVDPLEGPSNTFTYTWAGLPLQTPDGDPYIYYFTEEEVSGYTREYANPVTINDELYGEFVEFEGLVRNIYQVPSDDIEATKTWIGGENVRPDLWFQLRRTIEGTDLDEAVEVLQLPTTELNEETVSVTFMNVNLTDENGNAYNFYVVEGTVDGETGDFIPGDPENFVRSGSGLALTNTFESPLIAILARKIWDGGPITDHVAVALTLSRRSDEGEFEVLDIVPVITPEDGNHAQFNYIWADLPEFDQDGNPYEYLVTEELELDNYDSDVVFDEELGIWIVTNTYVIPQLEIAGTKSWFNDTLAHRPGILEITLFRAIGEGGPEEVITVEVFADEDGNWMYDFGEQDFTDFDGNVYTYFIEEEVPDNYLEEYAAPYFIEDVLQLDVSNTLIDGDLYIIKADQDGNPITNNPAEFRLTRISPEAAEGEEFSELFETDENGELTITDLLAGTYSLEETRAPSGFNLLPDDIIVVIEKGEDGETIVRYGESLINEENPLVIRNRPSQQLPDTGSMGTTVFTLLGLALMGGTVYGLKKNKKRI